MVLWFELVGLPYAMVWALQLHTRHMAGEAPNQPVSASVDGLECRFSLSIAYLYYRVLLIH